MEKSMVTIQDQRGSPDIGLIERLLAEHPGWGRSRLSVKLCELWDWRADNGRLKDMACRSLLLRLEKAGHITLPPRQRKSPNGYRNRSPVWVPHCTEPIESALKTLTPLQITCVVNASEQDRLFRCLLSRYHYLGLRNTVGETMKYLVHSRDGQPLACLLFGAAAWKCGARDAWIGWRAGRPCASTICRILRTTRAFSSCPGSRFRNWPVICSRASRGESKPIGWPSMDTLFIAWRPLSIAAAIAVCAIAPPTGNSARARDGAAMTASIA
jgi:hypothetical protein